MLFNSFAFAVFLPVVFVAYWLLARPTPRPQNAFLILASCFFYGWWDYRFLALLFVSSFVDFVAGCLLEKEQRPGVRRALLIASLGTNLGILAWFKYFNFFVGSFVALAAKFGVTADGNTWKIILPVGLSFYTFQSMAYTIDIYRGRQQPARNWIDFFAFVSFFPQLVAGPIQRAGDLLPQFQRRRELSMEAVRLGGEQILWGLAKKLVVADNLRAPVDEIVQQHAQMGSITLFCGVFFFALQIYCDFSGYSDIAIGTSRLFGVQLTRNFAYPYFARDLIEFWQRWHISLSTWFRDYLYIPLGGNRAGPLRWRANLLATFAISGLWHGANWTFVIWGLFHGLLYAAWVGFAGRHRAPRDETRLLPAPGEFLGMAATFFVVLISWVFFRAESLPAALDYLRGMFTRPRGGTSYVDLAVLVESVALCGGLLALEWWRRARTHVLEMGARPRLVRWPVYYAVIALIFWKGNLHDVSFMYFNF